MNLKTLGTRIVGALIALGFVLVLAAPAASAAKPVHWIDLMGTASQKPEGVFFTANSGPQVRKVKWNGWGKRRTVGRGTYLITSPPPPGQENPRGPARIVAWKPVLCTPEFGNRKGKLIRVYRKARMLRPVAEGGRKWVDISAYTGWGTCR